MIRLRSTPEKWKGSTHLTFRDIHKTAGISIGQVFYQVIRVSLSGKLYHASMCRCVHDKHTMCITYVDKYN